MTTATTRLASALLLSLPLAASAATLTLSDAVVFSADGTGHAWQSLIWNTQGQPEDGPNRYNLYLSRSTLPASPDFVNHANDGRARISIDLAPGTYTFGLFGEGVGATDPALHFVLNLYFGGSAAAGISGLIGPGCAGLCPASSPNGWDRFGTVFAPEAGTLSLTADGLRVELTGFSWANDGSVNVVSPHWANDPPYADYVLAPDYYGSFSMRVESVPAPGGLALVALGLLGAAVARRRRT